MDTGFDQPKSPPDSPRDEGLKLLRELDAKAPLVRGFSEDLQGEGWKEFYTFRGFNNNGSVNVEHLRLALDEVARATAIPEDWEICRAKLASVQHDPLEKDRIMALMKKETEARIEWEKANGYR
jgi:hypothetical protein